ncbi:uncharacterized protein METZ01_LOCUS426083 [marine metagenome]|uniref:Uncharacterized protein n=1 Tax=marine metagenome TaxID=408172 RepID=A0A382XQV7_9ZZZZ
MIYYTLKLNILSSLIVVKYLLLLYFVFICSTSVVF